MRISGKLGLSLALCVLFSGPGATLAVHAAAPAAVTSKPATNVQADRVTLNGAIDVSAESCDARGFDYGLTANYSYEAVETGDFGTGAFSYTLTGLSSATTYYFRAKAHSSAGWSYGNDMQFTTGALPAAMVVYSDNLFIEPTNAKTGQEVNIVASVTNTGRYTGAHLATLTVNGKAEAAQEVILAPGESKLVTFIRVKHTPGTYYVRMNELTGSFKVTEAAAEPLPPPAPLPDNTASTGTPFLWPVIALVGTSAILVYLIFRQRSQQA